MDDKAQRNIDRMSDPSKLDPNLPVEAQLEKAGETPPVKNQYADSPTTNNPVVSTHDRDSVQPPDPTRAGTLGAPEMPLKEKK